MAALSEDVHQYPDSYQYERAERLKVSIRCVGYALKRLGVTYKKNPQASAEKRFIFCRKLKVYESRGRPLIFIDESGFAHDMPRTHGYAPKGKRCYGCHDWGAKGRTNVIGVLLTASLFQDNINTTVFTAWVKKDLIPKLPEQAIVIMDNATFHKGEHMKKALQSAGHTLLYLPPYSPDLNPIEQKWAQVKARRRKTKQTIDNLLKLHEL